MSELNAIRAAYEASGPALAASASRAYVRALVDHQDAAFAGDPGAARAIREAGALLAVAVPALSQQRDMDPEQRRLRARRSIA
ncbi:hypothetical protein [Streptomyces wuyuanensis]|uniref:hypothetical protein n=1 Tax=Streptomyces wuyuanensis TaxID=1196353 RepID=UPI003420FC66